MPKSLGSNSLKYFTSSGIVKRLGFLSLRPGSDNLFTSSGIVSFFCGFGSGRSSCNKSKIIASSPFGMDISSILKRSLANSFTTG
ncbi:hypothetical protein BLOT_008552 [Blomia tropicalis]|nr:hypothetical protein BLOT_008552 [Blomia tropicalis]